MRKCSQTGIECVLFVYEAEMSVIILSVEKIWCQCDDSNKSIFFDWLPGGIVTYESRKSAHLCKKSRDR